MQSTWGRGSCNKDRGRRKVLKMIDRAKEEEGKAWGFELNMKWIHKGKLYISFLRVNHCNKYYHQEGGFHQNMLILGFLALRSASSHSCGREFVSFDSMWLYFTASVCISIEDASLWLSALIVDRHKKPCCHPNSAACLPFLMDVLHLQSFQLLTSQAHRKAWTPPWTLYKVPWVLMQSREAL